MRPLIRVLPALALVTACSGGDPFPEAPAAGTGTGPRITWDLGHQPLPEVPIPNDIATRADPNSPTGLRINASLVAPTRLESAFRAQFDELDGWGPYQAITIPFEGDLDLANIAARHQHDDFDFTNDAVYLIDLGPNDESIPPTDPRFGHPGLPMPLDLGEGNFQFTRRDQSELFPNDPRAGESNTALETVDEDTNHDGVLQPWEDSNFDGVLGRPSIFPRGASAYDNLTSYWEATTHTLIMRPVLPLLENHRYAVIVTDRLVGTDGQPVRSPFDSIAHPTQADSLQRLDDDLRTHPEMYGALRWSRRPIDPASANHVAFAWRYTTQTVATEWFAVRDGIYGHGPFAQLAQITPRLLPANVTTGSSSCTPDQRSRPFILRHNPDDPMHDPLAALFQAIFAISDPGQQLRDAWIASYRNVAYVVIGSYHTPYLLNSDPQHDLNPETHWQLNPHTGEVRHVGDSEVPFVLIVPRASTEHPAPFPIAFYTHGYGAGITESFDVGGVLAQHGIATMAIDGPTHGLPFVPSLVSLIRTFLRGSCATGVVDVLMRTNRARDLNGSGIQDPAGDFWTAYVAHSRDNVRQYALDISQLVRGVRGWDGHATAGVDLNQNGNMNDDIGGDFDGDGVPDVGAGSRMYVMGESLGGIMSMMIGASEPHIRGAIPYSGGGGLSDVALRSSQGGLKEAVYLRLMGPLVVGIPTGDLNPSDYGSCRNRLTCNPGSTCVGATTDTPGQCHATRTACAPGQISLRILATDVTSVGQLEFGCATLNTTAPLTGNVVAALHPGDDIVVENIENHGLRCARVQADGRFRVPIPSDTDDRLSVHLYPSLPSPVGGGSVSAIANFGTCEVSSEWLQAAERPGNLHSTTSIDRFAVIEGDCSEGCGHMPTEGLIECTTPDQTDCNPNFHPTWFRVTQRGQALVTPAEGLGLRRQTPEFRRFLTLSQALLDKGDPINFAPYYYLRATPSFEQPERHGVIVTNTIGDQNVPVNSGNAFSRAAGIIPFLPATAPDHLREYRTPAALWTRYGRTPNRVLIERNVLEGITWLNRWPTPTLPGALFDVDDIDEGTDGFGEITLSPPLRLVRLARPERDASELDAVWAPTIGDTPWMPDPNAPLMATMNYYVRPEGHHSVDKPPQVQLPFDYASYAYNLAGRFFSTDSTDVYYRSHPSSHLCLQNGSCIFPR